MPELGAFQDAFCAALRGEVFAQAPWRAADHEAPGMSVYRNTILKGAVDVLAGIYGTVVKLAGEDWFRGAAADYARDRPPASPSLVRYGADFPDWLAAFPPAQDSPYLAEAARLDELWNAAYFAADAEPLPPTAFAGLREPHLAHLTTRLHPSAGLAAFRHNIASLWLAHRAPEPALDGFELTQTPEQVLVVRPALDVEVRRLAPAAYTSRRSV
jgi:hypothetical protein